MTADRRQFHLDFGTKMHNMTYSTQIKHEKLLFVSAVAEAICENHTSCLVRANRVNLSKCITIGNLHARRVIWEINAPNKNVGR